MIQNIRSFINLYVSCFIDCYCHIRKYDVIKISHHAKLQKFDYNNFL